MPIYEYFSPATNKIYSFFARSSSYADRVPRCPDGDEHAMEKILSGFSVTGVSSKKTEDPSAGFAGGDDPLAGMNESQVNAAMHELEKTVGSMDEDNPDPRQMGQLMRKMAEVTGEKLDDGMEEVVRKLEEGTDPDELEERMGDLFGDEEGVEGMPGGEDETQNAAEGSSSAAGGKRLRRPKPSRDPQMYELADFM
ncbi:MAG: hypothetical protein CMI31_10320 [Opitutae bacterium]|nr:hypothetical protein [Opitutae bacterium]